MSIRIPTGKQYFTGSQLNSFLRPCDSIYTCWYSTTISTYFPSRCIPHSPPLGINSHYDTLRAKSPRPLRNKARATNSSSVNTDLVSTCLKHTSHIIDTTQPSTTGHRNENLFRNTFDYVNDGIASLRSCPNI